MLFLNSKLKTQNSKLVLICLLLTACCLLFLLLPALAEAGHFPAPTPTNSAAYFLGSFKINGLPAQPGDEVAFFDPQGVLCGLYVVTVSGQYGWVSVYGDDTSTSSIDEGASPGDILTVKIWDSRAEVELEGSALTLSQGFFGGSPTPSLIPPQWQNNIDYALNIDTGTQFIIELRSGWNFISTPIQPSVTSISAVLSDISPNVRIVWGYDNQTKQWFRYRPVGSSRYAVGSNTLTTVESGKGYWIYMENAASLTITGHEPSSPVHLYEGWNLVGYNGLDNTDVETKIESLRNKLGIIWSWDKGMWKYRLSDTSSLSNLTKFSRGMAYWIKMSSATEWTQ